MRPNTIAALIARTVSGQDDYGNDIYTETATAAPGIWAPGNSTESVQGQDQVTYRPTVYLPTGTDASAVDAVIPQATVDSSGQLVLDDDGKAQGTRFEINGQPEAWPASPSGWQPEFSVVVQLERITG